MKNLPKTKEAVAILRALNHPLRMKILKYIDKERSTNVNKIYNTLKIEQSVTSQHLSILRNAKLVNSQREGKKIIYSINYANIDKCVKAIEAFNQK
ncbi:MAG: metalloregulator ArsR/SmtB family transcription factor [Chitinophagales bacterium]